MVSARLSVFIGLLFFLLLLTPPVAFADVSTDLAAPMTTASTSTTDCSGTGPISCSGITSMTVTLNCSASDCATTYYLVDTDPANLSAPPGTNYSSTGTPPNTAVTINSSGGTTQYIHYYSKDTTGNYENPNTTQVIFSFFTISGTVYVDSNCNGSQDGGESGYGSSFTITPSSGSVSYPGSGTYSMSSLTSGTYTLTLASISNYYIRTTNPLSVPVGPSASNQNFGICQYFTISGTIYRDTNSDNSSSGEPAFTASAVTLTLSGSSTGSTTSSTSDGTYAFSVLYGTYTITPTAPSGFNGITPTSISSISITNANVTGQNFLVLTYSISGNMYMDKDNSSSYNGGDVAYTSANGYSDTVNVLFDGVNQVTGISTGSFTINNLTSGSRAVSISTPAGYRNGIYNGGAGSVTVVNSGSGLVFLVQGWTIQGYAYYDYNHDGYQDCSSDGAYSGGTITLSGGYTSASPATTSSTNNCGSGTVDATIYNYNFTGLKGGSTEYTVTLTVLSGFAASTTNPVLRALGAGYPTYINFGITPYYSVTGSIYMDVNNNSAYNAGTDNLFNSQSATVNLPGYTSITTSNGLYTFTNVLSGSYAMTVTTPTGYRATVALVTQPIVISEATAPGPTRILSNINFLIQGWTIRGYAYYDYNHNGVQECSQGDGAYSGGTMTLSAGYLTSSQPFTTTSTSNCGSGTVDATIYNYNFTGLKGGANAYTLTLTVPAGYTATTTNPITTVNLGAGEPTYSSFGITYYYTITGSVYMDVNNNSAYNAGTDNLFANPNYTDNVTVSLSGLYATQSPIVTTNGSYTFTSVLSGTDYTVNVVIPTGYRATVALVPQPIIVSEATAPGPTRILSNIDFLVQGWTLRGYLYNDYDHNGVQDCSVEDGYSGGTVTLSGGYISSPIATTTNATVNCVSGALDSTLYNYNFTGLKGGLTEYKIELSVPPGYIATVINPYYIALGAGNPKYYSFGITRYYSITGFVYVDTNKNKIKDGGESAYSNGTSNLSISTITVGATTLPSDPSCGSGIQMCTGNGAYTTGARLLSGTYTVSYTSLPNQSYIMTDPLGSPPSFSVTVGKSGSTYSCSPVALCDSVGNMSGLNFGITNSIACGQFQGGDAVLDNGYSCKIPPWIAACGNAYASISTPNSTTPGIIFSGNTTPDFGAGQASAAPSGWVVGTSTYPRLFTPVNSGSIRTSYEYMITTTRQSGITTSGLIELSSKCTLSSCTLPSDPTQLPNGIYHAGGNVTLNAYTFPSDKNYVILIDGDLRINGKIKVPTGSTLLISVSGTIRVDKSVGEVDPTSSTGDVEGIFSADGDFIVEGTNDCTVTKDIRFNFAGSVIVNAAQKGGSFTNNRDMCEDNLICPAYSFRARPDFTLNAPLFIRHQNFVWKEVAP